MGNIVLRKILREQSQNDAFGTEEKAVSGAAGQKSDAAVGGVEIRLSLVGLKPEWQTGDDAAGPNC